MLPDAAVAANACAIQPARASKRRKSKPVPKPQAALTLSANAHTCGFQPPANGRPLSGATTISATRLVSSAPRTMAAGQYPNTGAAIGSSHASTMPHRPPQNAEERTVGTPSGGTGAIFQAGL